jgi:hypothetical protein
LSRPAAEIRLRSVLVVPAAEAAAARAALLSADGEKTEVVNARPAAAPQSSRVGATLRRVRERGLEPARSAFALIAALLALGVAVPAAHSGAPNPIVGGREASAGEYPAQGYLEIDLGGGDRWSCGGTLVADRLFLTAAHCVTDFSEPVAAETATVALGELDLDEVGPEDVYDVNTIDVHEDYNDPIAGSNDVALVTLSAAAPFTPLPLVEADKPELWDDGTTATIIGWGTTSYGGAGSGVLLEAEVPMTSDDECDDAHGAAFDPTTMVCAGDGIHDTCQGDSGGPLMVANGDGELVLAGITSWGYGCADPEFPGVYTRVGSVALNTWIRSRLPAATTPPPAPPPPPTPQPTPPPPTEPPPTPIPPPVEPTPPLPPPPVEPTPPPPPPPPVEPAPQPQPRVVRCLVPRLKGRTLVGARRSLARANCRLGRVTRSYSGGVARGRVIRQQPTAGRRLARYARVSVVLSRGQRKR